MTTAQMIRLSEGNSKLRNTLIFNTPAQLTCIMMSTLCKKECYAMKAQIQYPSARKRRLLHFEASQKDNFVDEMNKEIESKRKRRTRSKERKFVYFRIHESGDFYSQDYLDKWVEIIKQNSDFKFLIYTKSWHLNWEKAKELDNLSLRFSNDVTTKPFHLKKALEKGLPIATIRKEGERTQGINCQPNWKCDECRLCWDTKANVSFQLH
jgi:hypothetical protein